MFLDKTFGIIGGDIRQIYLAEKFKRDGNNVLVCGIEKLKHKFPNIEFADLNTLIKESNYIIFPVPTTRDGKTVNLPFSDTIINLDDKLFSLLKNKVVFGGIISPLIECVNKSSLILKDYCVCEDFMIQNAIPTVEAAIKIALNESVDTLYNSKCLVIGYGRIGKILSKNLKNMGAEVTVSARSIKDLTWAKANGFKTTNISRNSTELHFDLVFNTVPTEILNFKTLRFLKNIKLIIDVASAPGGVDKPFAEQLGIKVISALGLPGKHFPKTAGEIISNVIYRIIKEENL